MVTLEEHRLLVKHNIRRLALRQFSQTHGLKLKKAHVTSSVTLEIDGDNILIREIWLWIAHPTEHKEGLEIDSFVVGKELKMGRKQLRVINKILRTKGQR